MTLVYLLTFDVNLRNSVLIQPVGNEGVVLASAGTSWRADALLVQVTSRDFWFELHKPTDMRGDSRELL
jgi:hypothetical protein